MKTIYITLFAVLAAGILADPEGSSVSGQTDIITTQFIPGGKSPIYRIKINDSVQWFTNGIVGTLVVKSDSVKINNINLCGPFRRSKSDFFINPIDTIKPIGTKNILPVNLKPESYRLPFSDQNASLKLDIFRIKANSVIPPPKK
jgi:hypothetical protein